MRFAELKKRFLHKAGRLGKRQGNFFLPMTRKMIFAISEHSNFRKNFCAFSPNETF